MKKTRRTFLKTTTQFTLATGLTYWWMSCESKPNSPKEPFLDVSKIFSDNLVLQRDQTIPIWGWANVGATIELFFNEKKHTTIVDKNGRWQFDLPALPAGGTHQIKIKNEQLEVTISNILIGDVFLCSGQSNMEWPLDRTDGSTKEIASANDDQIRHFKIPVSFSTSPQDNLKNGKWKICMPENAAHFSAAAYYFAKNIRQHHDVPIGIVNATKGGTPIKMWMSAASLELPSLNELVEKKIEKKLNALEKKFGAFSQNEKNKNRVAPDLDDEDWVTVQLPLKWGEAGFKELLGEIWFRKKFYLQKEYSKNSKAIISIGQVDDSDETFLNGKKIGEGKQVYKPARQYEIDPSFLQKGKNVLSVRLENYGEFGGLFGNAKDMFIEVDDLRFSLAGDWKMKVGDVKYNTNHLFESGEVPSVLYNSMIHPLSGFPFKAILWYQGESDVVMDVNVLFEYRFLFQQLIQNWRKHLQNKNLPFVFAQLSNAHSTCKTPVDSRWARFRASQESILQSEKNTAQVINIDSGKHENSMHPQNKPELGRRFAFAIRQLVYKEKNVPSYPIFQKIEKHGKQLHVHFSNVANGLLLKFGDQVNELAIAGADQQFLWAKSKIENDKIIVWHDDIEAPEAVRYAWCDNPLNVNLYNSDGLPVPPFRSDHREWVE